MPRPRVTMADLRDGTDSLTLSLRVLRSVAAAESAGDAWIDAGRILAELDRDALLDIAVMLATVPRFVLSSPEASVERLDLMAVLVMGAPPETSE